VVLTSVAGGRLREQAPTASPTIRIATSAPHPLLRMGKVI
jgi:hypothetical protein